MTTDDRCPGRAAGASRRADAAGEIAPPRPAQEAAPSGRSRAGALPTPEEAAPRSGALPLIGAHIRTAGGLAPVAGRAVEIGAEVVQIFNSNSRMWRTQARSPEELTALVDGLREHGLPLFFHSIYLINLASPDPMLRRRSIAALADALTLAGTVGAKGVVTHIGSRHHQSFPEAAGLVGESVHAAYRRAAGQLEAGEAIETRPCLLLETASGAGTTLGGRLEELAALLALLPEACGVCLDTAHVFASGYPIHTERGFGETMDKLESLDLLRRIGLVHLNDSKTRLGSSHDRHDNLGDGEIGLEGLGRVVRHPALRAVPFVLEVPGLEGRGPDAANMERAKSLRAVPGGHSKAAVPDGRPTRPARPA